ncbi:MAG TPA: hypothetical protein VGL90_00220 [Casimicrobiaceae bacterium]|jgi:hypothetical protein|nr:hypothetical protein [Casimicrobiaceae bacterium]HWD15541.1 hypothetical protein [Casimicrobiaceae bacterium]
MCYEFELWNWKSRAKQRDQTVVPKQSSEPSPQVSKQVQPKAPVRDVKVEEKTPA